MIDFSFSDDPELQKLSAEVTSNPEDFEAWEKLVRAAEAQEGGLTRNSSPQAIAACREAYDLFLARYPLFYGYWKRYADLEFAIAGSEAAEMVYERGIASIGVSVDLWANYCAFRVETNHDPDMIRELFERGAESCGQDFLAHPFWDKYIEFEERFEQTDRIFDILARVIHLPLHQYSRYFERYNNMSKQQPIEKLAAPEIITAFRNEIQHATGNPADPERDLRPRLEAYLWECFLQTQAEVTKRWTYEQGIKRPYYHVTDLDQEELDNWKKYLDAEEQEGDYERVKFLYERCLVTAANYEEFWFRYVRWLAAQNGKGEEARSVYQRASCVYLPIALPAIRLQWAKFEESQGRVQVAIAIHDAIIQRLPSHFETIKSLANLQRRHNGVEAAIKVLTYYIEIGTGRCDDQTRGALTAEWARMLWRCLGSSDRARSVFRMGQKQFLDSEPFWSSFLTFEMEQPHSELEEKKVSESRIKSEPNTKFRSEFDDGDCVPHDELKDGTAHERIKHVVKQIRTKSNLPREVIKGLSSKYMLYLEERGGQGAMEELLKLDFELNGPTSVQAGTGA